MPDDIQSPQMKYSRNAAIPALMIVSLFAACTAVPWFLADHFHPAIGAAAALLGTVVWTKLVRPMPGFAQGVISINGLFAIVAVLVVCLVRTIKLLWN